MTVSIRWHNVDSNILQYTFTHGWTWQEFAASRKIAEAVIKRKRQNPDELTDIIIDYSAVGNWFPRAKPIETLETPAETQKDRPNKKKRKHKYGHDPIPPKASSPSVPNDILVEHEDIIAVGCLYISGCSARAVRVFETMLSPAYEWDHIMQTDDISSIINMT